jgi:NAD(P)-dependent dehydrogenase (short-subunit alcohol dehydrogenase family)
MKQLRDRVAVVTGAASGIGLAVSEAFLANGMRVVLADLNAGLLGEQVERLRDEGGDVHGVVVDVTDPDSVDALGAAVIDRYGTLNVAVNNAGIVVTGNSWEIPLDDWHRVVNVDLWGVIHGIRTFVPLLLESGEEGHVVNTGSMASVIALPQLGPYTASKQGVLGLCDVLRAEMRSLGAPIGVSVVMPGAINTGMNPFGTHAASTVAANVVDAILRDRAYVFTDNDSIAESQARLTAILAARSQVV